MGLSFGKLIIILALVLIIFGAGKLPKVMGDVGRSIRNFRDGLKDQDDDEDNDTEKLKITNQSSPKSKSKTAVNRKKLTVIEPEVKNSKVVKKKVTNKNSAEVNNKKAKKSKK